MNRPGRFCPTKPTIWSAILFPPGDNCRVGNLPGFLEMPVFIIIYNEIEVGIGVALRGRGWM
jgi:hypothetical protein